MRNLKKFLALVLAMIMVVSASAMVSADFTDVTADNRYAAAINDLTVKGIVKGTSETTFNPADAVARYQMALFVARAITGEVGADDVWANGIVPFVDVDSYKGAIQLAYLKGIINGTSATTFDPNGGITYVAALKMAVCALGYGEDLTWPWGYYNKAVELGLNENMDVADLNTALNRAETAQIIYNMIKAVPADGGLTFEAANFSVAVADNTTLFVIAATPKQFYYVDADEAYNSASDVEGDFVGLQALVNGVPTGKILYTAVENIGLTAANVEDYFNYAVELVNFDEATGEFTGYVMGDAPKTITDDDITYVSNKNKLVIEGVTYTGVEKFTGATLINEMVIYDGTGEVKEAKILLTNKDGDIVDGKGNIIATFAYESSTGAKYYYDEAYYEDNKEYKVISESAALALYGIAVEDAENPDYVEYNTITTANGEIAATLYDNAYEMKLFDDDRDGMYERAYYAPIYLTVYDAYAAKWTDENGDVQKGTIDAIAFELEGEYVLANEAIYTNDAAKEIGTVLVFTYNKQLNKVNVIDIVEMQKGYVEKIDARNFYKYQGETPAAYEGVGDIKVTIDGTDYKTLYDFVYVNDGLRYTNVNATFGAEILEYNVSTSYDVEDVAERPFIQMLPNRYNWANTLIENDEDTYVGFYAYNGYIVFASTLTVEEEKAGFAVLDDFHDFDLGQIELDLWVGDELQAASVVTKFLGTDLAKLSSYKFSQLLAKEQNFYPGLLFATSDDEGNYALDEIIDTVAIANEYDLIDGKLALAEGENVITFEDGTSTIADRASKIRTGANTVFYFVENAACDCTTDICVDDCASKDLAERVVKVFVGQPDDATITLADDSLIFVDKLGYGRADSNGRASFVYVTNATIDGFFNTESSYVYTINVADFYRNTAAGFGLSEDYEGWYYKYEDAAVNLDDASVTAIYSKVKLAASKIYKLDENGVVELTAEGAAADYTGLKQEVQGERDYIKYGIVDTNGRTTSITSVSWENEDGKVTYFDYYWFVNNSVKRAKKDAAIAELVDALNAIKAGAAPAEFAILGNAAASAQAFVDSYAADPDHVFTDKDFDKIPADIKEIELVNPVLEAEYVNGYVTVEALANFAGVEAGKYVVAEGDHIKNITVVNMYNAKQQWTGEKAMDILNNAPYVMIAGARDSRLFNDNMGDDNVVFLVDVGGSTASAK